MVKSASSFKSNSGRAATKAPAKRGRAAKPKTAAKRGLAAKPRSAPAKRGRTAKPKAAAKKASPKIRAPASGAAAGALGQPKQRDTVVHHIVNGMFRYSPCGCMVFGAIAVNRAGEPVGEHHCGCC